MSKKVNIDKQTSDELNKMSQELGKSIDEVLRLLTWMGRQALGREITINEPETKARVKVNFKKFKKMAPLDVKK